LFGMSIVCVVAFGAIALGASGAIAEALMIR
jgi:hypothetical protein